MTWREFQLDVTDDLIARFEVNVDKSAHPTGCHIWTGPTINAFGHGYFNLGYAPGRNHGAPAHRVAWVIEHRQVIPPRTVVRHHPVLCNNAPCVNADHLLLGTITQNMLDKRDAGTMPCGEAHYQAKLTEADVREIRARYMAGDGTAEMIAADYPVTPANVVQILAGRSWKHVTGGVSVTQPAWRPKLISKAAESYKRGADHGRAIHTPDTVLALVATVRSGQTIAGAARDLGFTESSARQIVSGRSWSHVTGIARVGVGESLGDNDE